MSEPVDPTVEQKAEVLARAAAARAASLALADADKATELAVIRAVKDANVERDLRDHAAHLKQINGSQQKTASALEELRSGQDKIVEAFNRQTAITEALAESVRERSTGLFSRRTLWVMVVGACSGYVGLLTVIITSHP